MKKITIILLLCLAAGSNIFSQGNYKTADIFKATSVTWFGIDFSLIRMIGPEGFTDPVAIKNQQFDAINNLILNEPDKYDLKKFFFKQQVPVDMSVVNKRNELPDEKEFVLPLGAQYTVDENAVKNAVKSYNPDTKEGIGLVFIMEMFNKPAEVATMWVTFFDIAAKEVLLTAKMSGEAKGFGFRNYWTGAVNNVLKEIGKKKYDEWKKQYGK